MTVESLAIAIGVFGIVFCGGRLLTVVADRYHVQLDARLRKLSTNPAAGLLRGGERAAATGEPGIVGRPEQWVAMLSRLVADRAGDRQRHQLRFLRAGIYNPVAVSTFITLKLALIVAPPVFGLLVGWWGIAEPRMALLYGCIAGGFGMVLPSFWLDAKIRQRHGILRRSLADFLDLMIVCLESGLSLQGTIQRVSDELLIAHPILAGELNIVQRDVELGFALPAAFRRFADRSGFAGIRSLSAFIRESQRYGTQMADALRLHADMLRSQREQEAEEKAQRASIKILLPTLLLILPAVFVVLAGPAWIQIQDAFVKK